MSSIKVALLGFGTVGEGVYKTIESHSEELTAALGKKVEVVAVLIKNKQKDRKIREDVLITTDFEEILGLPQLDVVIEAIVDKEQPYTFLKRAIKRGCHIITANKEMFAHHGNELLSLAVERNVAVGFEATVAGGIPVIQTLRQLLTINRVQHVQGILNGTSNFILTEMREKKQSFAQSLLLAQQKGYAEADPTNDVEGYDAFYKTMILSRIAFGEEPIWQEVEREGITSITSELMEVAEKRELRFKHIATISKAGNQLKGTVRPTLVGKEHPFFHVEGVENAVIVQSDIVGRITLQGPGAGMFPTASAVIEDLVFVCQDKRSNRGFSGAVSDRSGHLEGQNKEYWLIHGLTNHLFSASVRVIERVSEGVIIIHSTKKEVEKLVVEQKGSGYYPILGGYEIENEVLEETAKAL